MELSKEESLNKNYMDIFDKHGVMTAKHYTITVSPTFATLQCHAVNRNVPNGTTTIGYLDITKHDDIKLIADWLAHYGRTDTPDLENKIRIICAIMDDIYWFINRITTKLSVNAAYYAKWYVEHGYTRRSDRSVYGRWVTKMACGAILNGRSVIPSEFELYEFSYRN